jgi:hypothetical protein
LKKEYTAESEVNLNKKPFKARHMPKNAYKACFDEAIYK